MELIKKGKGIRLTVKYASKKRILFFLYVGFCNGYLPHTINAQDIKELEFQRDKWSGKSSASNINKAAIVPVEVKLKVDEKQTASRDGIKFTVQWINHSAEAITLYNVIDKLSLVFLTKDYLFLYSD